MKSSSRTNNTRDGMKQLADQNVHHVDHVGFVLIPSKSCIKHKPTRFVGALRAKRVSFLLIIGIFLIETKGISTIS